MEYLTDDHQLSAYVARQSLVSATSPPIQVSEERSKLASAFQTRQLRGDLAATLMTQIQQYGVDSDVILMDLIVERLGVIEFGGSLITRSNELLKSGLNASLPGGSRWIKFGTDRHRTLWKRATADFAERMDALGLKERVLVLDTPWAERSNTGAVLEHRSESVARYNEIYEPYYARMAELGFQVASMPREHAVGDDDHKWGASPYHYIPTAYEWIAEQVRSFK